MIIDQSDLQYELYSNISHKLYGTLDYRYSEKVEI